MSTVNPYLKQYQKSSVETATPEQVLILLYDGAIQFLNKSKVNLEQNDIEQFNNNILGCENIILEFMGTLNMEIGGELAERLYHLYEYLYNTLVMANIHKDVKKINEVLKHLTNLRETWKKAIVIANGEKRQEELKLQNSAADENDDDDDDDEDEDDDEERSWGA